MSEFEQNEAIIPSLGELYAYNSEIVCFKPTMKDDISTYNTIEGARDYFLGKDGSNGFLSNKWTKVEFVTNQTTYLGNSYIASNGKYYFSNEHANVCVPAYYSMVFNSNGQLVIHHSSLPAERGDKKDNFNSNSNMRLSEQ